MYLVTTTLDGKEYTLMDLRIKKYTLINPVLTLGLNRTGSLKFNIPHSHPNLNKVDALRSVIKVYRISKSKNGKWIKQWMYSGRPITSEEDFYRIGTLQCEGILAYLIDSRVRAYKFYGTPYDYFEQLRLQHNSQVGEGKRFEKGTVDLFDADNNNYITRESSDYPNTLNEMSNKLTNLLGVYIGAREEDGKIYLDCTSSLPYNTQKIRFGKNLLDMTRNKDSTTLYTAIIPLGAQEETEGEESGKRITIQYFCPNEKPDDWEESYTDYCTREGSEESGYQYTFLKGSSAPKWVANTYYYGLDYIYDRNLRAKYDIIATVETWDDVTLQSNLFRKGKEYLNTCTTLESLVVSAVDLSLTKEDVESFVLGWVTVISEPHELKREMIMSEIEIPLLDPANAKFTIGSTIESFTESTNKLQTNFENQLHEIKSSVGRTMDKAIKNATQLITGAKGGYLVIEQDESGHPWRMLVMDAPSTDQAVNIIQINKNGIGFSTSGINGPYRNAWTIDGNLIADYIKSGTMQADRIRGGILQSNNYAEGSSGMKIDMDNGKIDTNHLNLGDYLRYQAGATEPMIIGGWQVRKVDTGGGRYAEYWDTKDTQENGIGAYGPWVVWGGWNGQEPLNVDNYKFVVMENGACKAMEFLNGSRKEWKEKIEKYETDALSQIRGTDVCRYKIKGRKKDGEHIGFVIGDGYQVSPELLSQSGGAIDLYKAIAVAYKAIQELADIVDKKGGKK